MALSPITKLNVRYQVVSREERGTSLKRAEEAVAKIKFFLIIGPSPVEVGVFPISQMRLMLGSNHLHYIKILTMLTPEAQYDDEDSAGWPESSFSIDFSGTDGLEVDKFKPWASKFRGGRPFTELMI